MNNGWKHVCTVLTEKSRIVEEKMAMLQLSGTATPRTEQVPEALEQDVATMLDNLDLFG